MAYDALVERNMSVPRAKLFAALTDFGGIKKVLGDAVESCELTGTGVGCLRTIKLAAGARVVERLEIAHDQSIFAYTMTEVSGFPIKKYFAVVFLADNGKGGTNVTYGSNWEADGMDEDELRAMLEGLYNAILDGIAKLP